MSFDWPLLTALPVGATTRQKAKVKTSKEKGRSLLALANVPLKEGLMARDSSFLPFTF
jgi:hypothetical protein